MPAPANVQAATLEKLIDAWKTLSAKDTMALWSDDFKQQILPLSLGAPVHSRTQAEAVYPKLTEALSDWKLEIRHVVHDAARSTAAIYAASQADTPLPGEKWTNEYAMFVSFSEDGTKITRLEEMIDTAFYHNFFPKFQKYMAERSGGQ